MHMLSHTYVHSLVSEACLPTKLYSPGHEEVDIIDRKIMYQKVVDSLSRVRALTKLRCPPYHPKGGEKAKIPCDQRANIA